MPRYISLFTALAAPLVMAASCNIPAQHIEADSALCAALNDPSFNCTDDTFYKSQDGKWYRCGTPRAGFGGTGLVTVTACLSTPTRQVSDQEAAILEAWAGGNTTGSGTPPVADPILTDTPTSTPPPTTTPPPD